MLSSTELQTVRHRPARTLYIDRDVVFVTGYREFVSKRLDLAKLLGTLVRQSSQDLNPQQTAIIAAVDSPELAVMPHYYGSFHDFRRFSSSTLHVSAVLDHIFDESGDAILICAGAPAPFARLAHEDLTRSLKSLHRKYEGELAEYIIGWEEPRTAATKGSARRVVVQDKPGKPYLLNVEESTLKHSSRKWQQTLRTGDTGPFPSDIVEGWAAVATIIRSHLDHTRARQVASIDICCREANLDLSQLSKILSFAEQWVETVTGAPVAALRTVCLNIPSTAITSYLRREMISRYPKLALGRFDFSSFALGWHPVRSLFASISRHECPLLFFSTADYPIVNLMVCWS